MAVWSVFLPAIGLHRYFLHADDLRDAEEEERGPDRPQRPPQTGGMVAFQLIRTPKKCLSFELQPQKKNQKSITIAYFSLFSCYDLSKTALKNNFKIYIYIF